MYYQYIRSASPPVVPSVVVNNRVEVREFLTSRRAKITPERAGLPAAGQRRVTRAAAQRGSRARRDERGVLRQTRTRPLAGVSAGVLDALARALQLDDAERAHLLRLAHEANGNNAILRPSRRPQQWTVRPSLQWSLDAITARAILDNNRSDLLAANHLGRAMYSDLYADPTRPPNFAHIRSSTTRRAASIPTGTWPPT